MNGAVLLIPLVLIRYGLLAALSGDAYRRAAHYPPMAGRERIALWVYQLFTILLIASLFFLSIQAQGPWFYPGAALYAAAVALLAASTVHFANASPEGFCAAGLYRLSRNPMYVAYFLYFLGCALLTRSPLLLGMLIVFQASAHWIILAEERWCRQKFAGAYDEYARRVRRYI